MNKTVVILISFLFFNLPAIAGETYTSEKHAFTIETVVEGLEYPWSIDFLPDGRILVTERPGRLRIIEQGRLSAPVKGLPRIHVEAQGGLLDIALDPDFNKNQIIYFSYSAADKTGIGTEVASAKLIGNELKELKTLFKALPKSPGGYHFGSRLLITKKGELFITLGERGDMHRAQDINDHAGSLIRINKDGSLPKDNPFIKNAKPGRKYTPMAIATCKASPCIREQVMSGQSNTVPKVAMN